MHLWPLTLTFEHILTFLQTTLTFELPIVTFLQLADFGVGFLWIYRLLLKAASSSISLRRLFRFRLG